MDNCWICEQWNDVEFSWRPEISGPLSKDPLFIHFDLDNFEPDLMEIQPDGSFKLNRMLPPKEIKYFFSSDGVSTAANDQMQTLLPTEFNENIVFYDKVATNIKIQTVNVIEVEPSTALEDYSFMTKCKPRQRRRFRAAETIDRWTIPKSLFKDYKFDNEKFLDRCFEFDWECSRILRVVKTPE